MASKRRLRKKACTRKKTHESQVAAEGHAKRLGFPYVAYDCKFCGGWHVGRPNSRQRQSLEAKASNRRN